MRLVKFPIFNFSFVVIFSVSYRWSWESVRNYERNAGLFQFT